MTNRFRRYHHHRRFFLAVSILWTGVLPYAFGDSEIVQVNQHGLLMASVRVVGSNRYDHYPSTTSTSSSSGAATRWKVTAKEAPSTLSATSELNVSNAVLDKQISSLKWTPQGNFDWVGEAVVTFLIPFEPPPPPSSPNSVERLTYSSRTFIVTLWQVDNERGSSQITRRLATLPRAANSLDGLNPVAQVTLNGTCAEVGNSSDVVSASTSRPSRMTKDAIAIANTPSQTTQTKKVSNSNTVVHFWWIVVSVVCIAVSMTNHKKPENETQARVQHRNTYGHNQDILLEQAEQARTSIHVQVQPRDRDCDFNPSKEYQEFQDECSSEGGDTSDGRSTNVSIRSSCYESGSLRLNYQQNGELNSWNDLREHMRSPRQNRLRGLKHVDNNEAFRPEKATDGVTCPCSSIGDSSHNLSGLNLIDSNISFPLSRAIIDQRRPSRFSSQPTKGTSTQPEKLVPDMTRARRITSHAATAANTHNQGVTSESSVCDTHDLFHSPCTPIDHTVRDGDLNSSLLHVGKEKEDKKLPHLNGKSLGPNKESSNRLQRLGLRLEGGNNEASSFPVNEKKNEEERMRILCDRDASSLTEYKDQPRQDLQGGRGPSPVNVENEEALDLNLISRKVGEENSNDPQRGFEPFHRVSGKNDPHESSTTSTAANTQKRNYLENDRESAGMKRQLAHDTMSGSTELVYTENNTSKYLDTIATSAYQSPFTSNGPAQGGGIGLQFSGKQDEAKPTGADIDPLECGGSAEANRSCGPKVGMGCKKSDGIPTAPPIASKLASECSEKEQSDKSQDMELARLPSLPVLREVSPQVQVACLLSKEGRHDEYTAGSFQQFHCGGDSCKPQEQITCLSPAKQELNNDLAQISTYGRISVDGIPQNEVTSIEAFSTSVFVDSPVQEDGCHSDASQPERPVCQHGSISSTGPAVATRISNVTTDAYCSKAKQEEQRTATPVLDCHDVDLTTGKPTQTYTETSRPTASEECMADRDLTTGTIESTGCDVLYLDSNQNFGCHTGSVREKRSEEGKQDRDRECTSEERPPNGDISNVPLHQSNGSLGGDPSEKVKTAHLRDLGAESVGQSNVESPSPDSKAAKFQIMNRNVASVVIRSSPRSRKLPVCSEAMREERLMDECRPTSLTNTPEQQMLKHNITVREDEKTTEAAKSAQENPSISGESYVSTLPPDSDYRSEDEVDQFKSSLPTAKMVGVTEPNPVTPKPLRLPSPILRTPRKSSTQRPEKKNANKKSTSILARPPNRRSKRLLEAKTSDHSSSQRSDCLLRDKSIYPRNNKSGLRKRSHAALSSREDWRSDSDEGSDVLLIGFGSDSEVLLVGVEPPTATKKARPFRNSSIVPDWVPSNGLRSASQQMEDRPWDVLPEQSPSIKKSPAPPKSIVLPNQS